jgi:hypothetical protein
MFIHLFNTITCVFDVATLNDAVDRLTRVDRSVATPFTSVRA